MTRTRLLCAHLVIAVVGLGSIACIVLDAEAWPFSHYPMYSELIHGRIRMVWLYGDTREGEKPLLDERMWFPLGRTRVHRALTTFARLPDRSRLDAAMAELARRYEDGRSERRHAGPAIRALRAYEVTWSIHSGARNRGRPDARRLLAETRVDAHR